MKLKKYSIHLLGLAVAFSISSCQFEDLPKNIPVSQTVVETEPFLETPPAPVLQKTTTVDHQYIVGFKQDANQTERIASPISSQPRNGSNTELKGIYQQEMKVAEARSIEFLASHDIDSDALLRTYNSVFQGMAVQLTDQEYDKIKHDEQVEFIEEDKMVAMSEMGPEIKTPFNPSSISTTIGNYYQIVPYGIKRVGGSVNFEGDTAKNYIWAWIVDTGVEHDNQELKIIESFSENFSSDSHLGDGYGHGTHVAGTIGARDNGKGVVGVAAGAWMANIKVLNSLGEGYYSDVVAGLDFIKYFSIPGDVVNMSIGGTNSYAVDHATKKLANRGVKVVVAAGNNGSHVSQYSPANVFHGNIAVVSAIDFWDNFMSFSNYGHNVDFGGPGQAILSTYGTNQLGYMSGTSMAAPHIAGVLLANKYQHTTDGNSTADPEGRTLPVISY